MVLVNLLVLGLQEVWRSKEFDLSIKEGIISILEE